MDFSDEGLQESKTVPEFVYDQDEISPINKTALLSDYSTRDDGGVNTDHDSTFSFTDLDDLNDEINSFLKGLQKKTNVVIGKVNSKVS